MIILWLTHSVGTASVETFRVCKIDLRISWREKKRIENNHGNPKIYRVHALTKVNSWATREQDPLNVMDCRVVTRVGRTDRWIECAGHNTIQPDWYCSKVVQTWQLQRYFISVVSVPPLIIWILTNFHAYVSPVGCLTLHGITSNVD